MRLVNVFVKVIILSFFNAFFKYEKRIQRYLNRHNIKPRQMVIRKMLAYRTSTHKYAQYVNNIKNSVKFQISLFTKWEMQVEKESLKGRGNNKKQTN